MKSADYNTIDKKISAAFDQAVDIPSYPRKKMMRLTAATVLSLMPAFVYVSVFVVGVISYVFFAIWNAPFPLNETGFFYVIFYLFILVLWGSIIVFMVRPFFSAGTHEEILVLSREQEPHLHKLVDSLSQALDLPHSIQLCVSDDVAVDAFYSSFRDYKNKKLTVKFGLPFVRTLRLNEFLALLAHEYAHIAHPKIRTCYFVIRSLRSWFYRIIHNEDGWNEKLSELVENNNILRFITLPIHVGIVIVNRIFQLFSDFLDLVSIPVIHDIELHADLFQVQFVGSDFFAASLKHIVKIDQSYHAALEKIFSADKIPADMSELIVAECARNNSQPHQLVEMTTSEEFNSWHMLPTPEKRIENIAQVQVKPKAIVDMPLATIFRDIKTIGKAVSTSFYARNQIDRQEKKQAVSYEMPINMDKYTEVLEHFTSGLFRRNIVWSFPGVEKFSGLTDEKVLPFLNKVIVSIRHNIPDFTRYTEYSDDYQKQLKLLHFYQWLIKDGSRNRPRADQIDKVKHDVKTFQEKHGNALEMYRKFYGVRVSAAVALGKASKAHKSAKVLIHLLSKISSLQASVEDAKIKCSTLEKLVARRAQGETLHQKTIYRLTRMVLRVIHELERLLASLPDTLINEFADVDIEAGQLDSDHVVNNEEERLAVERFSALVRYYEAYNTALSAKLAQFVEHVEKKRNIQSVMTVSLKKP